ncbi:hypothetical protein [Rhodococcoides corynebacterioides]|uniref:Uncharacterized protein n=1 Tax=Rhodococcoides corynebacterioides TaxID=53972 RepID=A0ABS7P8M0_9NOCA|nr:hypothetical protein [Rhodococcus corynebacterioides]MBY6368764.1 hypothetical protein [Rhodococcus corynebacterioides]MBY6409860.1 hypothetical protein [Rhodococcus corynebacterioides]
MTPQVTTEDVENLLGADDGAVLILRGTEIALATDEGDDLLVTTRAALIGELGERPEKEALTRAAAALTDVVAKLGA